jgi:hypothetical protein
VKARREADVQKVLKKMSEVDISTSLATWGKKKMAKWIALYGRELGGKHK